MADSASISTVVLLAAAATLLLIALFYPSGLLRWLQRKRYQYEVTFSLYMLTPTEKFVLNSVLFLLLSLFIIAASLYLPEHVVLIANRMFYYFSGDEANLATTERSVFKTTRPEQFVRSDLAGGPLAGRGRGLMEP